MSHHVVWVQYDEGGPWHALERPARYGKQLPPLNERQAVAEARELLNLGHRAKALPEGIDPNASLRPSDPDYNHSLTRVPRDTQERE